MRPAADSLDLGRDMLLRPRPGANLRANLVLYTALHNESINIIYHNIIYHYVNMHQYDQDHVERDITCVT